MTKNQIIAKPGGSKLTKPGGYKPPKLVTPKDVKSTPALTAKSVVSVNPLQPPVAAEETLPFTDMDYKIVDPVVEFNLFEIHNWCYDKYLDKDEMPILETHLSQYVVPLTHPGQDLVILCQKHYELDQRAIVNVDIEMLFTITEESINQLLQL